MLNLTYEHLAEQDQNIELAYSMYEESEKKIGGILADHSLRAEAEAYDKYVEAVSAIETQIGEAVTSAQSALNKLKAQYADSSMDISESAVIVNELAKQSASELYDTLSANPTARSAVASYAAVVGKTHIRRMTDIIDELFKKQNAESVDKYESIINASTDLKTSANYNLRSVFPDFKRAVEVANSRVE